MMNNSLLFILLASLLSLTTACAESTQSSAPNKAEAAKQSATAELTKISTTDESFDSAKESVEMAIADKGLIVSGVLHISDMLNRTGKDLGIEKPVYKKAEGIEFCSAKISHKMAQVDPSNVSMCPFTVVIYQLNEAPEKTHLSYRITHLKGDGAAVEKEITDLLQNIVEEAL